MQTYVVLVIVTVSVLAKVDVVRDYYEAKEDGFDFEFRENDDIVIGASICFKGTTWQSRLPLITHENKTNLSLWENGKWWDSEMAHLKGVFISASGRLKQASIWHPP